MTTQTWTDNEYDTLARALIDKFPDRQFNAVTYAHEIKLNDHEFTSVMQACLPPGRYSLRPRPNRLKQNLLVALFRLRTRPADLLSDTNPPQTHQDAPQDPDAARPVTSTSPPENTSQNAGNAADDGEGRGGSVKIRWSEDEWRTYAHTLHTLCPELHLLYASDLSGLTLHKINLAASKMPQSRRRTFKRLGGVAERLTAIYAEARRTHDPRYPENTTSNTAGTTQANLDTGAHDEEPALRILKNGIFWSAEEYKAIAAKLTGIYPRILVDGHMPGLTLAELNIAIRQALPPERHRRMANQAHIRSFQRRVRDALDGKSMWGPEQFAQHFKPAPAHVAEPDHRSGPRVFWSNAEWDNLLAKLLQKMPILETHFHHLSLQVLNEVAATMERPRRFFAVTAARKNLDLARARRMADALPPPDSEPDETTMDAASAPAPEPEPTPAPEPALEPTPTGEVQAEPVAVTPPAEPADKLFCKITWTREEWLAVAEELHRLHPVQNYPFGASLVGLETEDVAFAQERVLPLERQRRHLKVVSFSTLRASLERAFADLRAKLEGKPLPARPTMVPDLVKVATTEKPAEPPASSAVEEPAPPAPPAGTDIDPYRAAFAPLVALLASEVAKQLGPVIGAMIEQALEKLPAQVMQAAIPLAPSQLPQGIPATNDSAAQAPAPTPAPVKHYGDEKPRVEKQRRLTVGVLVNKQGQYRQELEKAFPMIEIKIGDVSMTHAADRIANCDRVICMTRWVDHVASGRLKKLAKERYVDCNGSTSELKRIIAIWLKSQGIAVEQVA
jgi:hypothetical protein